MTLWLVVWLSTSYDCPWGLGKSPKIVHELVCRKHEGFEYFMTSQEELARKKVLDLGVTTRPLILEIRGARVMRVEPIWNPKF